MREIVLDFEPRSWQEPLLNCQSRNVVAVVHRRAGKTTMYQQLGLMTALTADRGHLPKDRRNLKANPPRVIHVLPSAIMWKRTGMWDSLARSAELISGAQVAIGDKRIVMPNGGVYQTGGMDEPDRWRGGYADLVIEDEADDVTAAGLDMVVVPMLADYEGQRVKIGTPKGNGRLAEAYDKAGSDPAASRFLLGWEQTGVFTAQQIEVIKGDLDAEEFAQEFACSFTSPNSGSYYGKWLDIAIKDERITRVTYDPRLPVYTAWDLGMDDSTAIWWFQRSPGGEWRWLEYHEDSGRGLDHYAKLLKEKDYIYGKHYLPHDIEVRELTFGGQSRRLFLMAHGIKPIFVVPAANPADRVAAVRNVFARSFFDARGCAAGLKKLRGYRRQWNEHLGVWRAEPLHDANSHCADAIGTGVQGSQNPDNESKGKIPAFLSRVPMAASGAGGWMGR